jgi:hypothetical protein
MLGGEKENAKGKETANKKGRQWNTEHNKEKLEWGVWRERKCLSMSNGLALWVPLASVPGVIIR